VLVSWAGCSGSVEWGDACTHPQRASGRLCVPSVCCRSCCCSSCCCCCDLPGGLSHARSCSLARQVSPREPAWAEVSRCVSSPRRDIGSPCLSRCVHGASIGGALRRGLPPCAGGPPLVAGGGGGRCDVRRCEMPVTPLALSLLPLSLSLSLASASFLGVSGWLGSGACAALSWGAVAARVSATHSAAVLGAVHAVLADAGLSTSPALGVVAVGSLPRDSTIELQLYAEEEGQADHAARRAPRTARRW
jgi:hypothetical protein